MKKTSFYIMGAAGVLAASLIPASATDYNLTGGGSATINGAIYTTTDNQSTGTGVIDSFVRLQDRDIADGYNASARPVMPDVNTSPTFTRDLNLSEVPEVTIGGLVYYEFLLDINQTAADPLLSLDKLQIYTRTTAISDANDLLSLTSSSTLRYNLDTGGDNAVLLNYNLNNGSGSGDLFVYVLKSAFGSEADYLYLYSSFGDSGVPYSENDGFEEWAIRTTTPVNGVPDAGASLVLLGMGLIGVEAIRRKLS